MEPCHLPCLGPSPPIPPTKSGEIPHDAGQQAPDTAAVIGLLRSPQLPKQKKRCAFREVLRHHMVSNTQMYTPLARSIATHNVEWSPGAHSPYVRLLTLSPSVVKLEIVTASCGMSNWIVVRTLKGLEKFSRRMKLSVNRPSDCATAVPSSSQR